MFLQDLEYRLTKVAFSKKKEHMCSLLTLNLLKFEYQRELETLVVQTVNDESSFCSQKVTNVKLLT